MTSPGPSGRVGPGRLVLVVGPSGAGKDTLLRHARDVLAGDRAYEFPKRVVTRPPSEGEDNISADEASFTAMAAAGAFAVTWAAHGLRYGIPSTIEASLAQGTSVVCNVSRTVVDELRTRYDNVLVIEVTAPADVLARRLTGRSRAQDGDPERRLRRSDAVGGVSADATIFNAGEIDDAAGAFLDALSAHPKT